jgi:DNA polymerase III alpha subunit
MDLKFSDLLLDNGESVRQFNQALIQNADSIPELKTYIEPTISLGEFDNQNQSNWFMPKDYCSNLVEFLYDQCSTQEQIDRVSKELELFIQHNMLDVLYYLKYLVDTMRENNIVWGVGRGSSVASYCLYLLGVHKVDSIKYGLDINEFLR